MKKYLFKTLFCLALLMSSKTVIIAQSVDNQPIKSEFNDLNEALKNPDKVYRLNLSGQHFKEFPKGLSQFKNLEYLSLRNDHLTTLSPEIGTLSKLKVLDLGENDFKLLPKNFTNLKNLEELFLDNDKNLDVGQDLEILSKLPKLRILHLDNDGIKTLPQSIRKLAHLDSLYLSKNLFRVVPPEVKNLKNLKFLDLNHNHLPTNLHLNQPHVASGLRIKF